MKNTGRLYAAMGIGEIALSAVIVIILALTLSGCALPTVTPTVTPAATQIDTKEVTPTPLPHCTVKTGVPAGSLNLRSGAGTQHGVISTLTEKDTLTVLAFGDWLKVTDGRTTGYVNSKYCETGD